MPAPDLVRLPLLMTPDIVIPLTVSGVEMMREPAPRSTVPVKVSAPVFVVLAPIVRSPERVIAFASVKAEVPLATREGAPEAEVTTTVPVPSASALPATTVPRWRLKLPVNVLAAVSVTVPVVLLVATTPVPPRIAEMVPACRS